MSSSNDKRYSEAQKAWQASAEKVISRFPERKQVFNTSSDIEMQRCHLPESTAGLNYMDKLGFPGQFPYTRGVQPTMYRGRFWTMRQYSGFATAVETNERYKFLISQGTTGLSVAFDLPTQIGYDSDDPMSLGEVGKVGVAIDSLKDFEVLFEGIPLDKVSTSMTINSTASVLLAMYMARAEQTGVSMDKLTGTIQNDLLKEYIARGTYVFPPAPSMRLITDIFAFCKDFIPRWNTISISGYHIREAGSTAAQEVAFTLANAIAYVEAAVSAGLDVDDFAPRLAFFFNAHNNFLEEVAKFRAARRLWAHIMRDRFKAKKEKSMLMRFHTQTAGSTLTAQQPENNIVRVALQAMSAVMGGTQSLHTNSLDEAMALPTQKTVEIALRTQQIIAHESGVADTADPLAGSYAIESFTDQIEAKAMEYITRIDDLGGAMASIEKGYQQQEIQDAAYIYQKQVEELDSIVVGVNKFQSSTSDTKPDLLRIDPSIGAAKTIELAKLRSERDNDKVRQTLAALQISAKGSDNLMPKILDCVRCYATLGEITNALRDIFGEHQEIMTL
jgi:methylmalonyl-CoA mutase N-terminal domain/subunit